MQSHTSTHMHRPASVSRELQRVWSEMTVTIASILAMAEPDWKVIGQYWSVCVVAGVHPVSSFHLPSMH